jgi:hypothetical protein
MYEENPEKQKEKEAKKYIKGVPVRLKPQVTLLSLV